MALPPLKVDIGADDSGFTSALGRATRTLSATGDRWARTTADIDKRFVGLGASVGKFIGPATIAVVAAGFGAMVKMSIDAASAIVDSADRLGLTTKAYQELSFVAAQSGLNVQEFNSAMERLNVNLGSGKIKYGDAESAIKGIADQMAAAGSAAERADIAAEAFGSRAGARMIPMLKDGAAALEAMRARADELGVVLNDNLLREAEAAGDQMDAMAVVIKANLMRALLTLGPAIISVGEAFARAAPYVATFINSMLPDNVVGLAELDNRLKESQDAIAELKAEMSEKIAKGGYADALRGDMEELDSLEEQMRRLQDLIKIRKASQAELEAALSQPARSDKSTTDSLQKLKLEGEGLRQMIAAAWEGKQALDAVTDAVEARTAAMTASGEQTAAETQRIAALVLNNANLKRVLDAVKATQQVQQEAEDNQRLADALQVSQAAYMAVRREIELKNAAESAGVGVSGETYQAYIAAAEAARGYADQLERVRAIREAEQGLDIAKMQEAGSGLFREDDIRARDRAIARQEYMNQLVTTYGDISDVTAQRLLELWDQTATAQENAKVRTEETQGAVDELAGFAEQSFDRIGGVITEMFVRGEADALQWKNVVSGILSDLAQEFIKLGVMNPIKDALFGSTSPNMGGVGGIFGSIFGAFMGKAAGGPVSAGTPYIVGERGPELFMPTRSGTIVPNDALGRGGGQQIHITADMRGASVEAVARLERYVASIDGTLERRAVSAVKIERSRNPAMFGSTTR